MTGMELAKSLDRYSEKGEAYVKTLTGMIRVNELDAADAAQLTQQPLVPIVNAVESSRTI